MPRVNVAALALLQLLAASPTPGRWECQSMGADTDATVSVRGDEVVVYRAMYPEFEGKSYKLEHLFRLKLAGSKLSGQLFVRDDPKSGFAPLRAIEGVLVSDAELTLDGVPFRLAEAGDVKDAVPTASAPAPVAPEQPKVTLGTGYFAQVVGFTASVGDVFALRENITASREGQAALEAGEAAFARGQFAAAAGAYQKALGAGVPVSSFAENAARAWLALKDCAHAEPMVASAQRFDPESPDVIELVKDAAKTCPKVTAKTKTAKPAKVTLESLDAELGAGAPVTSVADVEEILHLDEVNRFPAAVAFIATQRDVKARALHGQLELDWAEGLSLLAQMNQNLASRLREFTAASEKKAAGDGLSADELRELGELRAAVLESQQTAKVLEAAAAEHLTKGLAIANEVIKANPTNYLGYRLAADSYRLRGDWKSFDKMLVKVEKANPNSNGLLFLKGVAAAQRDRDGAASKKFLSAALQKDPKFARAQAHLVLNAASLQSAREELDKLAAISPKHPFVVWTASTLEKLEEH